MTSPKTAAPGREDPSLTNSHDRPDGRGRIPAPLASADNGDLTRPTSADRAALRFRVISEARGIAAALVDGFSYAGAVVATEAEWLAAPALLVSLRCQERRHGLLAGEASIAAFNAHPSHLTEGAAYALWRHLASAPAVAERRLAERRLATPAEILAIAREATTDELLDDVVRQVDGEQCAAELERAHEALRSIAERLEQLLSDDTHAQPYRRIFRMLLAIAREELT